MLQPSVNAFRLGLLDSVETLLSVETVYFLDAEFSENEVRVCVNIRMKKSVEATVAKLYRNTWS